MANSLPEEITLFVRSMIIKCFRNATEVAYSATPSRDSGLQQENGVIGSRSNLLAVTQKPLQDSTLWTPIAQCKCLATSSFAAARNRTWSAYNNRIQFIEFNHITYKWPLGVYS